MSEGSATDLTVRSAEPGDVPSIRELMIASIRTFGPDSYTDEQVEAWAHIDAEHQFRVTEPGHLTVVAETPRGDIAGFGDVAPDDCELFAVYVHPDHARRGVGTAIRRHLETAARDGGCDRLTLTASTNAVGFYERAGYEPIETVDHEPTGPHDATLQCVRMAKALA